MTKASDNAFPSILITEGTEPSAPAAGKQRLYIDSTTHKLKRTDSSGVDVTIEAAAGAIATDTIWDAKGDLVAATGADAAAILAAGVNGQVPVYDSSQSTGLRKAYGLPVYAVTTADDTVSATAFADVPGMDFALVAAAKYFVEYFLNVDTNATSVGIKLALNSADAGTSIWLAQMNPTTAPALNSQFAGGITFTKDTQPFVTTTGPGVTRSLLTLTGIVVTTTNPDTLKLRHGSETATATTIYTNSVGRCTRLA